ncbi:hypothetical protein Leryth_020208 [Lithospermum erythrorhizon]|nr:hypothetical protein Leryth_020208 [Lithospermum erythrorhizon]
MRLEVFVSDFVLLWHKFAIECSSEKKSYKQCHNANAYSESLLADGRHVTPTTHDLPQETLKYDGKIFFAAEATNGIQDDEKQALANLGNLNKLGFEKLMINNNLDALVSIGEDVYGVRAIGGFPGWNKCSCCF